MDSAHRTAPLDGEIKPPPGVSGRQRQLFLSLNHEQRAAYRYHFDVCGRPAGICFEYATEGPPSFGHPTR